MLGKGGTVFKIGHFHFEVRVVFCFGGRTFGCLARAAVARRIFESKSGCHGSLVTFQELGIDMPSLIDFCEEQEFVFRIGDFLFVERPGYGAHDLRVLAERYAAEQC